MAHTEIEVLAYAMEAAYRNSKTLPDAVYIVTEKYPTANREILEAMCAAIDAYVDINVN